MIELINRQALKDAVKRYAGEPIKQNDRKCQAICLDMLGTIDAQPTIDAVPVVHGEWILQASGRDCKCSVCERYWIPFGDEYDFKYCPNCGARMDRKEVQGCEN